MAIAIPGGVLSLWLAAESHKTSEEARLKAEAEKTALEAAIAAANCRADEASAKAAASDLKAAEASRLAETERLERIKIQERLEPRRLTADQQLELTKKLSRFAGTQALVYWTSGAETATIGRTIGTVLHASGWAVNMSSGTGSRPLSGIVIETLGERDQPISEAATFLAALLRSEKLDVYGPAQVPYRGANTGAGMSTGEGGDLLSHPEMAILIGTK
jgi:hypothetical protein